MSCLICIIYVTAEPRGSNQDGNPACFHDIQMQILLQKSHFREGTKAALSTLIQTILISFQVLASIISCCMT